MYRIFAALFSLITLTTAAEDDSLHVEKLLQQMTLEEKCSYIGGVNNFYIRAIDRLGIPAIRMSDGPLGVHNYGKTTAYPASIALAASWNTELAGRFGTAMGRDARARGVHIVLAPGVNIYRAAQCGRNFEYFGEDPFLAGTMASDIIRGMQSQGVVATVKHYAVNNQEYDRNFTSSDLDERTLREIYLPAFKAAVQDGGVQAVMTSYNPVNGVHASQNNFLVNEILKNEWGFSGLVMSDWGSTYETEGVANGGLDLEMPDGKYMNPDSLLPLIKAGKVSAATIDDKVRRILGVIVRNGFLDRPQKQADIPADDPDSRAVALQMAREGIVLLKNRDDFLPLHPEKIKTIAVIGPNGHPAVHGGGGSSSTDPFRAVSLLEGIRAQTGGGIRVVFDRSIPDRSGKETYDTSVFRTADGQPGLRGEFFANMDLSGQPARTGIDRHINANFDTNPAGGAEPSNFSARWTGTITPDHSAEYRLFVTGDDGYRLIVDGDTLISAWRDQAPTTASVVKKLEQGIRYAVQLDYYQHGGGATIQFGYAPEQRMNLPATVATAKSADVVVLAVGFSPVTEGEGFDRPYQLDPEQQALIRAVLDANPNTLLVLTAGGNIDMNNWIDDTPALLHAWYPGQEGGTALAEIIFGATNPSGKLPATFEKRWEDSPVYQSYLDPDGDKRVYYSEGIFTGYRHFDREEVAPRFPFGFGLSYTQFDYSDLSVTVDGQNVLVKCRVRNSGDVSGAEIVQVYVADPESRLPRPAKELKGFVKVFLAAGAEHEVTINLDPEDFMYYDPEAGKWLSEPGVFEILVAKSSRDIVLRQTITLP